MAPDGKLGSIIGKVMVNEMVVYLSVSSVVWICVCTSRVGRAGRIAIHLYWTIAIASETY